MGAMMASALSVSRLTAALWTAQAPCLPPLPPLRPGPGSDDPFRAPATSAAELNVKGMKLYREAAGQPGRGEKWEEARARYRAALAADPSFAYPRLNIASSFVRQERYADAAAEIIDLLHQHGYVPWAREILASADLGALKVRPEMAQIREAMAVSARTWGAGLSADVLFVARTKAAMNMGRTGGQGGTDAGAGQPGVFLMGVHQEIFAWSATTGRYRQVTAEDGKVLAFILSPDRRRLAYVVADKLVRNQSPLPAALRGVAIRVADTSTLTLSEPMRIGGDVTSLELTFVGTRPWIGVEGDRVAGTFVLDEEGRLVPSPDPRPRRPRTHRGGGHLDERIVLTAVDVTGARSIALPGRCGVVARERRAASGPAAIEITARNAERRTLLTRFGAGLRGLAPLY